MYAYSIFCEGIDLLDCDNLSHQHAEPLRIEEIQITQLRLYIIVVQEHPTLMEKINGLQRGKVLWQAHKQNCKVARYAFN